MTAPNEGNTMSIKSTFNRMITAREKQARRFVNGALLNLDDETLKRAGYSREAIKNEGAANYPF